MAGACALPGRYRRQRSVAAINNRFVLERCIYDKIKMNLVVKAHRLIVVD
jgi:hypothetical protein